MQILQFLGYPETVAFVLVAEALLQALVELLFAVMHSQQFDSPAHV